MGSEMCIRDRCYLQVVPRLLPKGTACPFCKKMDYVAEYQGPLSEEARQLAMTEEQRVIELQIESNLRQEKAYMEKLAAQGIAVAASPGGNAQRTSNLPGSPTTGPSPYDGGHPQMNTSEGPSCISIFSSEECSSPGSTPMHRPNASPGSGCGTSSLREFSASFELSPRLVPAIDRSTPFEHDDYDRRWILAQQAQDQAATLGSTSAAASPPTVRSHTSPSWASHAPAPPTS